MDIYFLLVLISLNFNEIKNIQNLYSKIIFVLFFNYKFILVQISTFLEIEIHSSEPYDAIIILSGNPLTRVPHALEIYQKGYIKSILITDMAKVNDKYSDLIPNQIDIAKSIIKMNKIDANIKIVPSLKGGAGSTIDEAYDILEFAQINNYKNIIIVTDKFHTARAYRTIKKIFRQNDAYIEVNISGAENNIFNSQNWWQSDLGITNIFSEYIKSIAYLFINKNFALIRNY